MYTFLTLKQKVAELTQHVTYDSSGTATYDPNFMTKAGVWLNLSQKLLSESYDFWTELETTYDLTTVDGTEAYDMPSDFDKPYRVYDLTNVKEITPETETKYVDANLSDIVDSTEGEPSEYRIYGVSSRLKQMKLGLIPDDAYSVRIWYKKLPTDMSADGDYAFMDADPYLIMKACGYSWKWEGNEQRAAIAWAEAERALNSLLLNQMRN